jgi:hypothetical protein
VVTAIEVDQSNPVRGSATDRGWFLGTGSVLVACFAAAGALAAYAEYRAADGSTSIQYAIFWLAYALILLPTAWVVMNRRTPSAALPAVVVGLAVWGMVPKLLRTGYQILYFDEFDHFRILQGLAQTGHLKSDAGLLQIGATFPGLELFTSAAARVTGVSLVGAALAATVAIHVVALFGIFVLVRDLSGTPRAGALAALIYSLNPSWLFFDSQFSYEGLGIAVMIWTLVYVQRAISQRDSNRQLWTTASFAVVLSICLVTIHHVTSIALAVFLCVVAVTAAWRVRRKTSDHAERVVLASGIAAVAVIATIWRLTNVGQTLISYLAPSFRVSQMLSALLGFFGLGSGQQTRATLTGGLPIYEIVCAYVMIPILLVAFVWSVCGLWQRRRQRPTMMFALGLLGLTYFASLPLVAVRQFSESVHRTWGFSFVGLAPIIAIAVCEHQKGEHVISFRGRKLWPRKMLPARSLVAIGLASILIVAVGCVATGPDKFYRFGGRVVPGGDAVAYGTQTTMVAQWFATHTTSHDVLFADRYVGHAIAIASDVQVPIQRYLLAVVFAKVLRVDDIAVVQQNKVNFIVIDRRMATVLPPNGFWYGYAEPGAYSKQPLPENDITRFGCLNWLNAVFATSDYEVFRVNRAILTVDISAQSTGITHSCRIAGVH